MSIIQDIINKIIVCFLLFFLSQQIIGQNKHESWQDKLDAVYPLEKSYPDSAIKIYQEIINQTQKEDSLLYTFKAYLYSGIVWSDQGKYQESKSCYTKALKVAQKISYSIGEASTYTNLGNIELYLGNYSKAINLYLQSAEVYEKHKDYSRLSTTYQNIYSLYKELSDKENADKYLNLAKINSKDSLNLGMILATQVLNAINDNNTDSVDVWLEQINKIQKGINNDELNFYHLRALGEYARHINNSQEAIKYYSEAEIALNKSYNAYFAADLKRVLAISYMNSQKLNEAEKEAKAALKIATEIKGDDVIASTKKVLGNIYQLKNPSLAYQLLNESQIIQDSIAHLDYLKQVALIEEKFESVKKDKALLSKQKEIERIEIDNLKKKNQLITIGLIAMLLIFVLLAILLILRKQKIDKEKALILLNQEKEKEILHALLTGEEKERNRLAQELHDGINGDLSAIKYTLESSINFKDELTSKAIDMLDNSIVNVRNISHNLAPPSINKYGLTLAVEQFCDSINHQNKIDIIFQSYGDEIRLQTIKETAIYRIVQELVYNAMKHSQASELLVQLNFSESTLHITVEDNGVGMINKENTGLGWKNIQSRIEFLQAEKQVDADNQGTSVSIMININNHL
jgi:signal transduction histidine kinase